MDDERLDEGRSSDEPRPRTEVEAPPPSPSAPVPSLDGLSSGKEQWKGSGCSNRLPLYGCVIGLAVVIAFLMAGTSLVRRTVWGNFDNASAAVINNLPLGLSSAEVSRTRRNLDRFRAVLESSDDPYQQMGEFVTRVRALRDDGELTTEEVERLNLALEQWIEESGIPILQLESR
jgi:hypothetical protein